MTYYDKSISTPISYKSFELQSACTPSSQTTVGTGDFYTTRTWKEAPSAAPADPQFLHQTPLPVQWTKEGRYGIDKLVNGPYNQSCSGSPSPYYLIYRSNIAPVPGSGLSVQQTDWPLRLRLKLKNMKVNLASAIVEYRDTARMFVRAAKGVNAAVRCVVSRGKRCRFRQVHWCDIPASYLEATFGLKPLFQDVMDSIDALEGRLAKPVYFRTAVKAQTKYKDEKQGVGVTTELAIAYTKPNSSFTHFTSGNIAEMAWEAIPYSFVVDYTIGIGDWLTSLDALSGLDFVTGCVVRKHKYLMQPESHIPTAGREWETVPSYYYHSHEREVISSIPYPPRPIFDPSKSWYAIVNGIALLANLRDTCRRRHPRPRK